MENTEEYKLMVSRLAKTGQAIKDSITADDAYILVMIASVCGEAGELLDCIKKPVVYRKPVDLDNVIEELGDLEFYLEGIRAFYGITREQVLAANKRKLAVRYDKFYSDQRAQERQDKHVD